MSASTVKLGLMPPLTGLVGIYGVEIARAGQMACQEINERGGVLGRPLELVIEDDGSLPDSAVAAADRLVRNHGCVALIGNLLSNSRIAVAYRVAEPRRIPYLNFSFYEGSILSRYFFHFAALPNQQIDRMIPSMGRRYGRRMFFAGNNYEWPRGSIDAAKAALTMARGEIVGEEYCPIDLAPAAIEQLLDQVAAAAPDVFVPYFAGEDQLRLLTRFSERGMKDRMAVVMGHYDEVMASRLPPAVREGFYSSNTYFMTVDTPANRDILARLADWPGVDRLWPNGNGLLTNFGEGTYISVQAFAQAANAADSVEAEALVEALATVSLSCPQGPVRMDPRTHHARVNTYLSRCRADGSFALVEAFGAVAPWIPERYQHLRTSLAVTPEEDIRLQARMLEHMSEAVFLIRTDDASIVYANPGAERLFGYAPGELVGQSISVLNAPVERPPEQTAGGILEFLARKGHWEGDIRNVRKGGSAFWTSATVSAFTHPIYGEVWMSVQKDITQVKALQQQLDNHRQHLEHVVAERTAELELAGENMRLFVKHAPIGIAMFDRDMNYLATSDRWLEDHGRGFTNLVGRNHYELHPDIPDEWRLVHRQALAGATIKKDEDQWVQPDGRRQWLRWAVLPWTHPSGRIGGIIISAEDITERKLAEDSLRQSEAQFRAMADSAPVLIWVAGPDGGCTWFNQRWLEFTGRSIGQEVGTGWTEGVHPEDHGHCMAVYTENFDRRQAFEMEYRLRDAQGEYRWLLDRGRPRYGARGEFLGYIGSCADITMRKTVEHQLADAKEAAERASRSKSIFVANMSHEIRTPLHVIIGLGHLLRRDLTDPVQQDRVDQLCGASDHLLAIINDILELSKIEAHRLALDQSDFRLETVVAQVLRMIEGQAHDRGLSLTTDFPPDLGGLALRGDALRLAQVLINLCGNAVKFTDQGEVRLRVACLEEAPDRVKLRFAVEDTGIGMPLAEQARLFLPFTQADSSATRERGGTGLGLTISQRLVALMGSHIQVESQPGQGSCFSFELELPRATGSAPDPTTGPASEVATDLQGQRILFAEDNPQSQDILFEMLDGLGCEVDVASDGTEAVACAQERSYDLILMDVQMPKLDGFGATRAIRALPGHRDTPIIALTANAFAEDRQRCLEAGMNGHISKPVTPATLAAALSQWLSDLADPVEGSPRCDTELSRALAEIPGLEVGSALRRTPEHLEHYCRQLERFVTTHGQDMARLRALLAAGDRHAAHALVHTLKGIAGLIGARHIATLTSDIIEGLRAGGDLAAIQSQAQACEVALASLGKSVQGLSAYSPVT